VPRMSMFTELGLATTGTVASARRRRFLWEVFSWRLLNCQVELETNLICTYLN
jgi:hypothetical protein